MPLLFLLLACTPALRPPGRLSSVGRPPESPVEALARRYAAPVTAAVAQTTSHKSAGRPERGAAQRGGAAAGAASARIVATAESLVGASRIVVDGQPFRFDCSGLVEASVVSAGGSWRGSTEMLFQDARQEGVLHRHRRPTPGDVAFFDDTYDRDGNGQVDDALTHSAVVEAVDDAGTITLIHVGSHGIVRIHMNLLRPEDHVDESGAVINDYLRARSSKDGPATRTLAGELWAGFGSFWRNIPMEKAET
jgi:hypothetical protein